MEVSNLTWALTVLLIVAMLGVDLFLNRNPHSVSVREAAWSTVIWTVLGVAFTAVIWQIGDATDASEYFTGYLLERALSVDNVLVFVVILGYFSVPAELEHRALFWGVVGALVLRALFIAIGAAMLDHFSWTTTLFGIILLVTAIKLFRSKDEEVHPERNVVLKLMRRFITVTNDFRGTKILTREAGRRVATPLFAVLLVIGTTDVIFAVDSVPAVFGITQTAYIVFAANAFSLLGLRAMSSLLTNVIDRFVYLQPALAVVLALVGIEMIFETYYHPPPWVMLLAIVTVLGIGIVLSLVMTRDKTPVDEH